LIARQKRERACEECRLWNRSRTGSLTCSKPSGCDSPKEAEDSGFDRLDTYAQRVLDLFIPIARRLWLSGYGAPHVPRHELEIEAKARGWELSEHFLEKWAACERGFAKVEEYRREHEKKTDG
jgi:hypothetical protein